LILAAILDFMHFLLKHSIGFIFIALLTLKNLILDTKFMSLTILDQKLVIFVLILAAILENGCPRIPKELKNQC